MPGVQIFRLLVTIEPTDNLLLQFSRVIDLDLTDWHVWTEIDPNREDNVVEKRKILDVHWDSESDVMGCTPP